MLLQAWIGFLKPESSRWTFRSLPWFWVFDVAFPLRFQLSFCPKTTSSPFHLLSWMKQYLAFQSGLSRWGSSYLVSTLWTHLSFNSENFRPCSSILQVWTWLINLPSSFILSHEGRFKTQSSQDFPLVWADSECSSPVNQSSPFECFRGSAQLSPPSCPRLRQFSRLGWVYFQNLRHWVTKTERRATGCRQWPHPEWSESCNQWPRHQIQELPARWRQQADQ